MSELEIFEKLKEIFVLVVNRNADVSKITIKDNIINDLGVSSVGLIYLIVAIEETFGVDMSEVSVNTFQTIEDVIKYIQGKAL
jgi:acyl carrier protein